ncbi:MAG: nucleotidyltransferase domain-containing protein [Euryarchaeota archaeon]|nr:nucleotidyltransferase domain-containing protein [Euryarchaeota archaeon]MDE1836139.1 nucleotidyltransferase domain-containing protein [Euryarchaeota archaeon]MDE1879429.1 nucleotidyltransferase domain-containing protein [Euryarchaeota archaeon]MDE2044117.1 nucleotidyltransferase domain-containing protein [Thermoplasmata archaeon]
MPKEIPALDPELLADIIRRVVRVAHPVRIVLFGSSARGQRRPDSDVDLLVVVRPRVHRGHLAERIYQSFIGLEVPVDVIVATEDDIERHRSNPGLIYQTILEEGTAVYGS